LGRGQLSNWLGCGGTTGIVVTVEMVDVQHQGDGDNENQHGGTGDRVNHQAGRNVLDFLDCFFGGFAGLKLGLLGFANGVEVGCERRRLL